MCEKCHVTPNLCGFPTSEEFKLHTQKLLEAKSPAALKYMADEMARAYEVLWYTTKELDHIQDVYGQ